MDKVNCANPLEETHIEVCCDRGTSWRSMPAKVTMRLSPVLRVFIEITTPHVPEYSLSRWRTLWGGGHIAAL